MNKLFIAFWLVLLGQVLRAQPFDECKLALQAAFTEMSAIGEKVPDGLTYYIDYTVEAHLREAENDAGPQRIKALFTADRAMILNEYSEIYIDKTQAFSVLPKERKVIWSDTHLGMNQQLQLSYNKRMLDTLLYHADITMCAEYSDENAQYWEVELNCTEQGKQLLRYERVTFLLNKTELQVVSMDVQFTPEEQIQKLQIDFHDVDYTYNGPLLPIDFAGNYLVGEGMLSSRFRDYELVDVRK